MEWIEAKINTTTQGVEPVTGLLLSLGINGMIVEDPKDLEDFLASPEARRWDYVDEELLADRGTEANLRIFVSGDDQGRRQLAELESALAELKKDPAAADYGRLTWELTKVKEEDWANNWKAYFKPLSCGKTTGGEADLGGLARRGPTSSFRD